MDAELFSEDYFAARQKFRHLAGKVGAELEELDLTARGPGNEPLTIDIAWLGSKSPQRVLIHICGLHGLEGFAGSAIQLQLLGSPPELSPTDALIVVHAVNPFGMAWLRRVNENNVDLNRNFLAPAEPYSGASQGYRQLDTFLNPEGPNPEGLARAFDFFYPTLFWKIISMGRQELKQCVAEGQYDYPNGLFFGGGQLEESSTKLLDWLKARLQGVGHLGALDIHTGLGPFGTDALLVPYDRGSEKFTRLTSELGERVAQGNDPGGVAYRIRGLMLQAIARAIGPADSWLIYQEFGTYPIPPVLKALRNENRWHHYGTPEDLDHRIKRRMLEAFCPADEKWRKKITRRGHQVALDFAKVVFS